MKNKIVFFLLLSISAFGQQKAPVKFFIDNENGYFEILVDDTLLIKRYKDSLTVGEHNLKVWSYGYDISELTVTILPEQLNEVHVKLNRSESYNAYGESYDRYRKKFHKNVTVPVSVTIAMGITSSIFMINAYDLKKKIETDIVNYSLSSETEEIAEIKSRIFSNNQKYNQARYTYYITGGLFIGGVITSIYTAIKFKRNNIEPVLNKQSPFEQKTSLHFTGNGVSLILKI